MTSEPDLAWIASVVGDPARLRILLSLMDGRARTAKELAFLARIAAPTASGHLAKLLASRLVAVEPQGRHRYYRIVSRLVADMVESMAVVAGETSPTDPRLRRVDPALAAARTCYNHLAGRLAVAISDVLQARGHIAFGDGGGEVMPSGRAFFKGTASNSGKRRTGTVCFAGRASTGRSGGTTSPARWGRRCARIAWGEAGCSAPATRAR